MKPDLDGIIQEQKTIHHNDPQFVYVSTVSKTQEMYDVYDQIDKIEKELRSKKSEVEKLIQAKLRSLLPAGFEILEFGEHGYDISFKAKIKGVQVEKLPKLEKPKPVEPPKEPDAYEKIARHPNFVQILNSGVLTREEKRKVLLLPKEGE